VLYHQRLLTDGAGWNLVYVTTQHPPAPLSGFVRCGPLAHLGKPMVLYHHR
jgi:hypothetical protein